MSDNNPRLPLLYDPAKAAEMRSLNVTLTPAGQNPRNYGSNTSRGMLAAPRAARGRTGPPPSARTEPVARTSSVNAWIHSTPSNPTPEATTTLTRAGIGSLYDHFVRPVEGPQVVPPTLPIPQPPAPVRLTGARRFGAVLSGSSESSSANKENSIPRINTEQGPWSSNTRHEAPPRSMQTVYPLASGSRSPLREVNQMELMRSPNSSGRVASPPRSSERARSARAHLSRATSFPMSTAPVSSGRQPIESNAVSSERRLIQGNWGSDPVGPEIPSHLRQRSAFEAIQQMARLTDIPMETLTSDGVSIPATRPTEVSAEVATPFLGTFRVPDIGRPLIPSALRVTPKKTVEQPNMLSESPSGNLGLDSLRRVSPTRPFLNADDHPLVDVDLDDVGDVEMRSNDSTISDPAHHQQHATNLEDSMWADALEHQPSAPQPAARSVRASGYPPVPLFGATRSQEKSAQSYQGSSHPLTPAFGTPANFASEAPPILAPYAAPASLAIRQKAKSDEKTLKDSKWA